MQKLHLGYLSIAIYCLSTAFSAVWVSFSFSGISGAALTFFTLLTALVVFVSAQLIRGGNPIALATSHPLDVLILNVLTLASWLFMFMALLLIEASVESAIYQGWLPVSVLLCDLWTRRASLKSLRSLGTAIIALCLFGLVAARLLQGGVLSISPERIRDGILLATIAGLAGGLYVYWSARLYHRTGCTTLDILCTRFFLLLLVTGFFGAQQLTTVFHLDPSLLGRLLALACFSVVIPVFTLQYTIGILGSARVSIITPGVPALALAAEQMVGSWPSPWVPTLIIAVCGAVVLSNFWMHRMTLPQ